MIKRSILTLFTFLCSISSLLIPMTPSKYLLLMPSKQILLIEINKTNTHECTICSESKNLNEMYTLICNHEFCRNCLSTILDNALKEKNTIDLRCPEPSCRKAIDNSDIKKLTDNRNKIESLEAIQLQDWIKQQPGVKNCPTINCSYSFLNDEKIRQNTTCPQCNKMYCTNCLLTHNTNTTCTQAKDKHRDPIGEAWKKAHTKQCPKCEAFIEKTEGCRFMNCTNCKTHFCWDCLLICKKSHEHHDCKAMNSRTNFIEVNPTANQGQPPRPLLGNPLVQQNRFHYIEHLRINDIPENLTEIEIQNYIQQMIPPTLQGKVRTQRFMELRRQLKERNDVLQIQRAAQNRAQAHRQQEEAVRLQQPRITLPERQPVPPITANSQIYNDSVNTLARQLVDRIKNQQSTQTSATINHNPQAHISSWELSQPQPNNMPRGSNPPVINIGITFNSPTSADFRIKFGNQIGLGCLRNTKNTNEFIILADRRTLRDDAQFLIDNANRNFKS